MGNTDGIAEGATEGLLVTEGLLLGEKLGMVEGIAVLGVAVGLPGGGVGKAEEGVSVEGFEDGAGDGSALGTHEGGGVGAKLGSLLGLALGRYVGDGVAIHIVAPFIAATNPAEQAVQTDAPKEEEYVLTAQSTAAVDPVLLE